MTTKIELANHILQHSDREICLFGCDICVKSCLNVAIERVHAHSFQLIVARKVLDLIALY